MTVFKATNLVGLDFETYSAVDLFKHGLERYVDHPSFRPLRAGLVQYNITSSTHFEHDLDLVNDYDRGRRAISDGIHDCFIVAHNAGFERRVLRAMGINLPASRFIDSAVIARAAGAAGKLEAAAPQLLGVDKLPEGRRLIQLFSVPGKYQEYEATDRFVPRITVEYADDWALFGEYCVLDARLGLRIAHEAGINRGIYTTEEHDYNALTMEMNQLGWPVDVDSVEEMQRRYLENQELALQEFRVNHNAHDLNLNSLKQLKEWCADRGIKASSFNEEACAKMSKRIKEKLDAHDQHGQLLEQDKYDGYFEVWAMLETKLILGGSSLKKLQVILDTVKDGRLHDQYMHIGAGQTYRTTGRSVQMQNLKRLAEPDDMSTLMDPDSKWDNTKLAQNLRQVFTSQHPEGELLVGDFASVESRGLAWYASAAWKLQAFYKGKDMYKVLASGFYAKPYDQIDKAERTFGKVGELSCGYQAGAGAVQSFAAGMGVTLSEGEAAKLVADWRQVNPEVVAFWEKMDEGLHAIMDGKMTHEVNLDYGYTLRFMEDQIPISLVQQRKGLKSISITMFNGNGHRVFGRVFHGCYQAGRSINYHKPSQLKNGPLWSDRFTDPKTKQTRFYSIYGGKLAGILTQSLCREQFFHSLKIVKKWSDMHTNLRVIGQFHDEIVMDWWPEKGGLSRNVAMAGFKQAMETGMYPGFPLVAEIKHDHRYTK